ncbi:hypothetical protein FACS1894104_4210 [Actinomycetota bacterium]|nr:hypothetical protein FACS1894104_4210 [Actinomycetota bacterium]
MVQNYKQKSASSGSPRRRRQLEQAHTRSKRLVRPTTPKVFNNSDNPQGITVAQQRERNRQAGVGVGSSKNSSARKRTSSNGQNSSGSSRRSKSDSPRSGANRKTRQAKVRGGIKAKLLIVAVVIVVLIGCYIALYNSSFLTITNIQTKGTKTLTSEQILQIANVPDDSTFLRVDTAGITGNLVEDPWIGSATVSRVFPTTLVLNIEERSVAAVVDIVPEKATEKTTHWLISDDGTWIVNLDAEDQTIVAPSTEQLAKITKFKDISPAVAPSPGVKTNDSGITNALAILNGFSPEMRAMVSSISAPDKVKTTLLLYNNVGVAFGAAEDIKAKEDAISTLLEEHKGTITYINVRVANRATYRATE